MGSDGHQRAVERVKGARDREDMQSWLGEIRESLSELIVGLFPDVDTYLTPLLRLHSLSVQNTHWEDEKGKKKREISIYFILIFF